jgi:DHA1 family tetracycline resistance protein-like MFS transporter
MPDRKIMIFGLLTSLIVTPLYGLIWAEWQVFLLVPIAGLGTLIFPAVSAMKSNAVDDREQGAIQGALYGVRSIGMALGPLM